MIPAFLIKWGADIVIGLLVIVAGWWLLQTLVLGPMNAKHDAAAANARTAIAGGATASGAEAANIAFQNGVKAGLGDAKTHTQIIYLNKQPGANDPVNPAYWDGWIKSECLYLVAASDPQCDGLRQSGSR